MSAGLSAGLSAIALAKAEALAEAEAPSEGGSVGAGGWTALHSCTISAPFLPHFLARAFHNSLRINHFRICPAPHGAILSHGIARLKSIAVRAEKVQVVWASEEQIRSLQTRPFN